MSLISVVPGTEKDIHYMFIWSRPWGIGTVLFRRHFGVGWGLLVILLKICSAFTLALDLHPWDIAVVWMQLYDLNNSALSQGCSWCSKLVLVILNYILHCCHSCLWQGMMPFTPNFRIIASKMCYCNSKCSYNCICVSSHMPEAVWLLSVYVMISIVWWDSSLLLMSLKLELYLSWNYPMTTIDPLVSVLFLWKFPDCSLLLKKSKSDLLFVNCLNSWFNHYI